jgi:superfamily II DNA or RNA helicase
MKNEITKSFMFNTLKPTPYLPGWQVSAEQRRNIIHARGNIVSPNATKHFEKKGRLKKKEKTTYHVGPYSNDLMVPWQKEFARELHAGKNIIVGSVTSTGKTWIGNLAVAHETLEDDNATCLIISPNSAVMRDTVKDIETWHTKKYLYGTKTMLSTMTRNFQSYNISKNGPPGQIMVIAVDSVVDFMTSPINKRFIDNLKIILFDEVHMISVSNALWWSQYIPHTAQIVLLSATLGNPVKAKEIVDTIQKHNPARPQTSIIFTRDVRPIPLQLLTFKGIKTPINSMTTKTLKQEKAFSCMINPFDPTVRDLKTVLLTAKDKTPIPDDRELQFRLGTEISSKYMDIIRSKNADSLASAVTDLTPENIYHVLCCLNAKDMMPTMVFCSTTEQVKTNASNLVSYISDIENKDPEYRKAKNIYDSYQTSKYRSRDKDLKQQAGGKKKAKEQNGWGKPPSEEAMPKGVNMHEVESVLKKWKFGSTFQFERTKGIEQWIIDCIEYGIGVYVSTMKARIRYLVFDAMRVGKIKILFSDSSISVGINLPIRTVITCGPIPHDLFIQAGGRAGRRGLDTKGYIVQMMPKELIEKYTYTKTSDATLILPKKMSFTSLIRLQTPYNLATTIDPDITGLEYREIEQVYSNLFDPSTPSKPVDYYHQTILDNYLKTLDPKEKEVCEKQLEILNKEQWNYHRLTNLIKMIPEDTSILIIKLMITGKLKLLTSTELIHLFALLLFRVEATPDIEQETLDNEYYIPDFSQSKIPDLIMGIKKWASNYCIDIDFDKPIHRYISDYCYRCKHHLKYMRQLNSFQEWLYILVCNIKRCAPPNRGGYKDESSHVIYKADEIFMSATCRKDMKILI